MMKWTLNLFKTHKYAIIWTACYIALMYIVLRAMFKFDMFSSHQWHHLFQAELHGFPGFVFGILVLSAMPLYIATTTLIIRTKKPLFTIPVPKVIKTLWTNMQPTLINPEPEPLPETISEKDKETIDEFPPELPSELRTAYIRARMNIPPEQRSSFNQPATTNIPAPQTIATIPEPEISDIPLPSDFDIAPAQNAPEIFDTPDFLQMSAPSFNDIDFDTPSHTYEPVQEYLDKKSIKHKTENDLIITNKHVIASHTDSDFWICDDTTWFAAGKQRPSPIQEIKQIAAEKKLTPILYLGATNIMEIDAFIEKCNQDGIIVINDPSEIPE